MAGWNSDTAAGPMGPGTVTLVEGSSFCISLPNGDIHPEHPHGLFVQDTRILSKWSLTINGQPLEPLAAETKEPYRALFAGRVPRTDGYADSPLIVERLREVGAGIREQITVRNFSLDPVECSVSLTVEADFADLFEVKEARIQRQWNENRQAEGHVLTIRAAWQDVRKGVVIRAPGADVTPDAITYRASIAAHGQWSAVLIAVPGMDGATSDSFVHAEGDGLSPVTGAARSGWPGSRCSTWGARRSNALKAELRRPRRASHRGSEPPGPGRGGRRCALVHDIVRTGFAVGLGNGAAGGPIVGFGHAPDSGGPPRDRGRSNERGRTGKILHEVRLDVSSGLSLGGKSVYYGSVDATPLFVDVLGAVSRWGFAKDTIAALLPHADRALDWIRDYGDKDGDGFVEYQRLNDQGLINQGWKDSWDGINFADGRLAEPPIALCEVQAYVFAAYLARAWMAYDDGDTVLGDKLAGWASALKKQFNEQFWMPERGYYAVALDGKKQQVDACASNMGHCLWLGLIDEDKAAKVAERLMSPEMFSGWGVRTLASDMGAYNPASYHNGSVWPHDNAIIAAGLLRYGFVAEAQRISTALLEAAEYSGGRLPELFCGFSREQFTEPVAYPTACSPQAWAATTPILLVTSLMRYDAHVSRGGFWLDPVLPESYGDLHITNAPMAGGRITIDITGSVPSVQGLPEGMAFHRGHRPWITELVEQASKRHPQGRRRP